eukprot:1109548-Pelagomonas_calceolata.AAC.1
MGAHTSLLAVIHQDILIISIHAFNDSQKARRHTNALQTWGCTQAQHPKGKERRTYRIYKGIAIGQKAQLLG